jgi:cobyrinic acid a,c-diamide synthase
VKGRILIAGLRGSSGKTAITLGLISAWRDRGENIIPFKKGPDYIDAAWLALASGAECSNLDGFMMGDDAILGSFSERSFEDGIAVIEGNRGLFDGMDEQGTHSSAALARLINTPVVLVVDVSKTTRTAAAMVLGCKQLEPGLDLKGVILNRVANARQENVIRQAIERECGVPVLGAVPRISGIALPERHLGLLPAAEHPESLRVIRALADAGDAYLDLEGLKKVAEGADPWHAQPRLTGFDESMTGSKVRIGVVRDAAFQFYYPENLERLSRLGAELIEVSAIHDNALPELDALYLGGGFPETRARELADNRSFKASVRFAIEAGLPTYAECGGLLYLGKSFIWKGGTYPMTGVLPVEFGFEDKPAGHGYSMLEVDGDNPFFSRGLALRGHEFHYSRVISLDESDLDFAFKVKRGQGFIDKRDGITKYNLLASYSHVHALSCEEWAEGLVARARSYRGQRKGFIRQSESLPADAGVELRFD